METTKIALVTGGNRGLGLETVKQLAEKGVKVYLGSRDLAKGQQAVDQLTQLGLKNVFAIALDMADSSTFETVKNTLEQAEGKLDILVNNAGIQVEASNWAVNTATDISPDALRKTFEVNFFGLIELTNTLLPLLKNSNVGRIVNLSSILGSLTIHNDPQGPIYGTKTLAYNASKAALNMYTIHLAHALQNTNIQVNSAHPVG